MSKTKRDVPHVIDCWNRISRRMRAAHHLLVLLDFDGTLVAYCDSPEDVMLAEDCRRTLARLARHRKVHIAIVSGRRNAVLREFIRVPRIEYLGVFGSENHSVPRTTQRTRALLRNLWSDLEPLPELYPGVKLEDKGISHAVHFRGTPTEVQRLMRRRVERLVSGFHPELHVIQSNHACEIVPREVQGKGVAMRRFMDTRPPEALPIYVGDDLTDEPAFVALRSGITVRVGPFSRTHAHFRLKDPAEVETFLKRIEEELS